MAQALLLSGVATSRYAGRLFRPAAPSGPSGSITNSSSNTSGTALTGNTPPQPGFMPATDPPAAKPKREASLDANVDGDNIQDDADSEAAATAAALTAADSLFEQLSLADLADASAGVYDAAVDVETGGAKAEGQDGDPLPLVLHEAHTEQE